ncbi:alpha/beta hydrolase [Mycolicibacterium conceptionense]|uniref:Alpha/beta hydrolase n=1 Tax=Mycolicibacterium conceptionense TaxID=451644 RepID=A0A0U1DXU9_9MYCO|nr:MULTISPECIES: alpha/beta hydrolase [Mycolicibacterium]MCW1821975.1 alpha/beta hydrolase [Mycolicibacterium senegalense]OBB14081.1 alpha/beta hydrolase [Mycolicibacterium conceptionense]OBF07359.1 alpha/beta hydrolase [Mycolicibacterium conceptionense]OBF14601.1 alpha/beta hydrolase [Mycolicibacterium conceptionense]OBF47797.1 alpha/beta hydrolase [Mycolicibacterium conceptionense]
MTSREPEWEPDVLPGFWQHTIDAGPDPDGEGDLVATLVRRGPAEPASDETGHAVLALHGYTDYFFHTELADRFADRGFSFYALDLPKCGRSRHDGQTPHFTTDLARYDTELEKALAVIAADTGNATVCLYGHSAGGLILTLFADRLRRSGRLAAHHVSGLVLNSPFFDLHGPAILRTAPTSAALIALARLRKLSVVRKPTEGGYGTTLHRDYGGEFDYNLEWKPLGGFPVTFGWINAIRRGQARLHRGLDVGVPNLILRSDRSVTETSDPAAMQRGDAVLDVRQIARWSGCVGNHTTMAPITDAKHDVFLSVADARAAAYRELDRWLDYYLSQQTRPSTTPSG